MHCPTCGAELTDQAVFCHKCGERLDKAEQQFPPEGQGEVAPAAADVAPETSPNEAAGQPAPTPIEKVREDAAVRQNVQDEPEEELWRGGYSSKAMVGAWVLSGLISVALVALMLWVWNRYVTWSALAAIVLLFLYQAGKLCYRRMNVRYRLTTQRLMHETGILRRVTDRIETIDMDDIAFEQSLVERLVGVGTIRVTSSDRTHPELVLLGIENVKEIAGKIDDVRRTERRRRGLHIESI